MCGVRVIRIKCGCKIKFKKGKEITDKGGVGIIRGKVGLII
jgi:hypothetical protein